MRRICPSLEHIKLDKKGAEAFPELLEVLKCHSQSTDYMIQFFKEPVVKNCSCKGCCDGLIKPVRMPRQVYDSVMEFNMQMPIPKPISPFEKDSDVEYMSFADARKLPFTNEHQPSLAITQLRRATRKKKVVATNHLPGSRVYVSNAPLIAKLKNKSNFKIGVATKCRGVVECQTCNKPRCIFSQKAVSQMKPPISTPCNDHIQTSMRR